MNTQVDFSILSISLKVNATYTVDFQRICLVIIFTPNEACSWSNLILQIIGLQFKEFEQMR
jgi:hypothetical protein